MSYGGSRWAAHRRCSPTSATPRRDGPRARSVGLGAEPLSYPAPTDYDAGKDLTKIARTDRVVVRTHGEPDRMIEERLVWFWHDHFATSIAKVRFPYLMWQQHLTLRQHATGQLRGVAARDRQGPRHAALPRRDHERRRSEPNENFGRECLELFTMGRDGGYTQDDVVAASRSFTGWVVDIPGRPVAQRLRAEPW